ncbi:MAG: hypothetical protein HC860_22940 [Alkalinema sp. RU_4_3]|nr:hypothetical protein [Alkalinema sp. RU_4_3]
MRLRPPTSPAIAPTQSFQVSRQVVWTVICWSLGLGADADGGDARSEGDREETGEDETAYRCGL